MEKNRIKNPDEKSWKIGGIEDFLELSEEELAYIELKDRGGRFFGLD